MRNNSAKYFLVFDSRKYSIYYIVFDENIVSNIIDEMNIRDYNTSEMKAGLFTAAP